MILYIFGAMKSQNLNSLLLLDESKRRMYVNKNSP